MLLSLEVRDFVIVDHVSLEFDAGFTVLTGETGAGKSILIDALALVLGGRPEGTVVRSGRERAEMAALFAVPAATRDDPAGEAEPYPAAADEGAAAAAAASGADRQEGEPADAGLLGARAWLAAEGFPCDDDQALLRRSIDAAGRSRAWINGRPATVQQLRALGAGLLDIHGQHAHQTLLRAGAQRDLLDAFAGAEVDAAATAQAWRTWQAIERDLAAFAQREAELATERAALLREAEDLGAVALSAEAWAELQHEHARLAHASSLLSSAQWAVDTLVDGDGDLLAQLHGIAQRLGELESIDAALQAPRELIDSAAISLSEAAHTLRRYAHGVDSDPARLEAVEDQMQRLMACARRYRLDPASLGSRHAEVSERLADLEAGGSRARLEQSRDAARAHYRQCAGRLGKRRSEAARALGNTVTATIRDLAMGDGVFTVALHPQAAGSAHGDEQVEFCLAPHPGQPPGALARIASGGELSRVSLAIQTALSQVSRVPTLIFDEVDTGIGGRVAEIVGRLLHQVARRSQVMCVTHLPQVAAWADHHLQVSKSAVHGQPVSRIDLLDGDGRIEEVARMLGGLKLTDTSRQHARELLASRSARAVP